MSPQPSLLKEAQEYNFQKSPHIVVVAVVVVESALELEQFEVVASSSVVVVVAAVVECAEADRFAAAVAAAVERLVPFAVGLEPEPFVADLEQLPELELAFFLKSDTAVEHRVVAVECRFAVVACSWDFQKSFEGGDHQQW